MFVLIPSPLVGRAAFEPLAAALRAAGSEASIVEGQTPQGPPFWQSFAGAIASQVRPGSEIILVGHSGAGPALELIANRHLGVRAIVYLDATLVEPGACWLDTFSADALAGPEFQSALSSGVMPNPWIGPELWRAVGLAEDAQIARLRAGCRELPLAWYQEPVPVGTREVPAAYIAFVPNPFYAPIAEQARARGWPVVEVAGKHFHFLMEPDEVARTLIGVVEAMSSEIQP